MTTIVVIPTYNERDNIGPLIDAVLALSVPDLSVLVVDDSSPDGTADVVRARTSDPRVCLLLRPKKDGLGRAYTAAFCSLLTGREAAGSVPLPGGPGVRGGRVTPFWGPREPQQRVPSRAGRAMRSAGWERRQDPQPPHIIIQMDADFSHNPQDIPRLLAALETTDLAIGSRYVHGGGTVNWHLVRRALSRAANAVATSATGVPIRDLTGGFNAWRASALGSVHPDTIRAEGYGYLVELKVRAARHGLRVGEVPITFTDRRGGQSKLSRRVIWEAAGVVTRLGIQRWVQS